MPCSRKGKYRVATEEDSRQLGVALAATVSGLAQALEVQLRVNLKPSYCSFSEDPKRPHVFLNLVTQPKFLFAR